MIRLIIENINTQIDDFVTEGLTSLIRRGEQVYPAIYQGGGDSEGINFDFSKANLYHRITDAISIDQEEYSITDGLKTTETYPMRMVAYFPNNLLRTDDSYSTIKVAANLKNKLPAQLNAIALLLNLDDVEIVLNSVQLDSFVVWGQEFTNVPYSIPSTHSLISIDYTITLSGAQNCFQDYECE